jgi:hypothetical protein
MKTVSVHALNAQKKRTRRVQSKLRVCEHKLARALDKLAAAKSELKALRKFQPRKRKPKTIDGTFSVVGSMRQIEHTSRRGKPRIGTHGDGLRHMEQRIWNDDGTPFGLRRMKT